MASTDWTALTNILDGSKVVKNVSMAFTLPPMTGANEFTYGFNTLTSNVGVSGLYVAAATGINVPTPALKGGRMSIVMKRYSASGLYAPIMGLIAGIDVETAVAYFVGLTQGATSYQIVLKKGTLISGLRTPDSGVLRVSTEDFDDMGDTDAAWHHLQLDVLVNPHGEVRLIVTENDLSAHDADNPSFMPIAGMNPYVDDSLGAISGSAPLTGAFRFFYGMYTEGQASQACLFDQAVVAEQLLP